jgi:hypothetical protein
VKVIKRNRPASAAYLARATDRLLADVPELILSCWAVEDRGLADGLAVIELYWRDQVASGKLQTADMEASILPVAHLLSAMLTGYLRGTPIADRPAAFARLVEASEGALGGEPKRIQITAGIT